MTEKADHEGAGDRLEHAIEHAAGAVKDRARAIELGLLKGDHSIAGEVAGVVEEVVHPEGEDENRSHGD